MKLFFYLLCFTLVTLTSCKQQNENIITDSLDDLAFFPRECKNIAVFPVQQNTEDRRDFYIPRDTLPTSAQDLLLYVHTTNGDIKAFLKKGQNISTTWLTQKSYNLKDRFPLAQHNSRLEQNLTKDAKFRFESNTRAQTENGSYSALFNPWEYRVTGVKNFRIEAMSSLFGQAAGTSLNRYFSIYKMIPKQVISYRTRNLVWGYRFKEKLESIDKWLSLQPMAPPAIIFRLNATPQEVPARVKFITILETTEGNVLRDTTEVDIRR